MIVKLFFSIEKRTFSPFVHRSDHDFSFSFNFLLLALLFTYCTAAIWIWEHTYRILYSIDRSTWTAGYSKKVIVIISIEYFFLLLRVSFFSSHHLKNETVSDFITLDQFRWKFIHRLFESNTIWHTDRSTQHPAPSTTSIFNFLKARIVVDAITIIHNKFL